MQVSWPDMVYKSFCIWILSFTSPILCGTPAYLVNFGYESPKLVAPAIISLIPAKNHKLFQVGMVGWSVLLRSEFGYSKNLSFGISQDFSPLNANASIYRYKNGKREGFWIGYYDNGQLMYKGNWKNGKREGSWVSYWNSGKLKEKQMMNSDKTSLTKQLRKQN